VADNSPFLTLSGDTMYLASFRGGGQGSADIWMSPLQGGIWQPVLNMGSLINSSLIDFSPCVTADNQNFYLASTRGGDWDIWLSIRTGGQWGPALAVAQVNSGFTEMHPFVTADGQQLYFTSNRTGGVGGSDIYVSQWGGSEWGVPQLVSGAVNTTSDENHSSLTQDGLTMYFSSNQPGGFGGPDIYVSQWTGTEWGTPENLGTAINSGGYEQFPAISGDGLKLLFVSDRNGGFGNFDIWESSYEPTTDLWGVVSLEGNPPDLSGSVVVVGSLIDTTDSQGQYFIMEVPQGEVTLMVFHTGYVPFDTVLFNAGGEFNITLYEGANPTEFFDDFENGLSRWVGSWGLTDESSHSPSHSLTDSPHSNYLSNQNIWQCMVQGVDLSGFQSAELTYWTKYQLETGFDYVYLEASTNDGSSWLNMRTFNGNQTQWRADTVDIGSFAGQENLKFRFRLSTDGALEMDGLYVDDFRIEGGHEDLTPPLIVHSPDSDTISWIGDQVICAEITDVSGVQAASLFYRADGGGYFEIAYDSLAENRYYYFTIPGQDAGTWTEYYFHATDGASPPNTGDSEIYAHIFGTILYYDDGDPEYIYGYAQDDRLAVWFSIAQSQPLATLLFRFYKDETHDLDTVEVYVWSDLGGYPYQVQLGPLAVYPVNTLEEPTAWTRVDMRPHGFSVNPEFHAGCQMRSTLPVILGDDPAVSNRSHAYVGSWGDAGCDFHLRAVVGEYSGAPEFSSSGVPLTFSLLPAYPNPFNFACVVPFTMNRQERIQILAYNILGQKVATLLDGLRGAGNHQVVWNAESLATGIYFLQLKSVTNPAQQVPVRKVLLLK